MNNATPSPLPVDDEIGPLDEHGQQIWSPETEAAVARMHADPAFWEGIAAAEADFAAGRVYTHEEVLAESAARRARYRAEHNR